MYKDYLIKSGVPVKPVQRQKYCDCVNPTRTNCSFCKMKMMSVKKHNKKLWY